MRAENSEQKKTGPENSEQKKTGPTTLSAQKSTGRECNPGSGHLRTKSSDARTVVGQTPREWIGQLLATEWKRGRKRHIPVEAEQKLQTRLEQPHGFNSYGELQQWLKQECGVEVSYSVVHLQHVRYRLKAKLKVPRLVSTQ